MDESTTQYPCPLCDKKFSNRRALACHKYGHKETSCDICNKKFPKTTIRSHMRSHAKYDEMVRCDKCDKSYP